MGSLELVAATRALVVDVRGLARVAVVTAMAARATDDEMEVAVDIADAPQILQSVHPPVQPAVAMAGRRSILPPFQTIAVEAAMTRQKKL